MGDEIAGNKFKKKDFRSYLQALQKETELLHEWFSDHAFSEISAVGGFEQEAWLIDQNFLPAAINEEFLAAMQEPLLSPELARFNVELNVIPRAIEGKVFSAFQQDFFDLIQRCYQQAATLNAQLIYIGILPTVRDQELCLQNISALNRYRVLNERVMSARKGKPVFLDISGEEHLRSEHEDVMLEAAATSFQIHRQIPFSQAKRYFNAAVIASAPIVAVSANSPYLFGRHVWEETRIPLFEQAVEVGGYQGAGQGPIRRVTFGSGYVRESIEELFVENLQHYPVLLPVQLEGAFEQLPHLRLHNGTIWRWNRPLIGFDADGTPHLRVEHRVASAGPTLVDEIANSAFFFGLHEYLAHMDIAPEFLLDFSKAKDNFYHACRLGIKAQVHWFRDTTVSLKKLVLDELLPMSRKGLQNLGVDSDDIDDYLTIIEERVQSGQTGAAWQRQFVERNGRDMQALTQSYLEQQKHGEPVHRWQ